MDQQQPEQIDAPSPGPRPEWIRPEVDRFAASGAEGADGADVDGADFQS